MKVIGRTLNGSPVIASAPGKVRTKGPFVFHASRQCVLVAVAIRPRFGVAHWRGALWVNIRRSLGLF